MNRLPSLKRFAERIGRCHYIGNGIIDVIASGGRDYTCCLADQEQAGPNASV